jgi:hypothetical protein
MVLKILRDGIWDEIEVHSYRDLYSYKSIQDANESFQNSALHTVQSHEFSFYCNQQEVGIDLPENEYDIIGSDDGTTCHIILASYLPSFVTNTENHEQQRRWLISHIAGVKEVQEFGNYCHQNREEGGECQQTYDIYLMGGFGMPGVHGGDPLSEKLSQEFVNFFQLSENIFHLRLFFTCEVNTSPLPCTSTSSFPSPAPAPRFFGCGYQKSTNSVVPMTFPMESRGPDYFQRSMALWLQSSATTQQNHGTLLLLCRDTTLRIDFSFLAQDISPNSYSFFHFISHLPRTPAADQQILRYTSTSPSCEPSHFVTSIREIAKYVTEHFSPEGRSLYQGPPLVTYRRQLNGETQRVEWLRGET